VKHQSPNLAVGARLCAKRQPQHLDCERRAAAGSATTAALRSLTALGVWIWILALGCFSSLGASLDIAINPKFSGEPVQPDSLRYETSAKENFSITRVSYLVSGFALQRTDGSWLDLTNEFAWFDLEKSRSTHWIRSIPAGEYRALRFHVGLDEARNHSDPAQYAADHPLNPNLNNLHWNWQGGYIFLAVEGMWRNASGSLDGWSYHFARDTNRTLITIATPLNLTNDIGLELGFDLGSLLNAPRPISFSKDGSSTHSREGDPIAAKLSANLPGAFGVRRISALTAGEGGAKIVKPLYLPEKFTPYPFQMSATFPLPDLPRDNPLIIERVTLGEKLFHETALSKDNTLSCASCHDAKRAFTDPRKFSVGVRGQIGTRNAMPLFNLAWRSSFFWDGRAPSLRAQALMPIQDHTEMDETLTNVVNKLSVISYQLSVSNTARTSNSYLLLFAAAFGTPEITPEKIGLALESFMLTLTSFDSKFDRAIRGEEKLSAEEQRGLELFMTEYDPRREQFGADCFHCHGGALFQSQTFANNGLDSTFTDAGRAKITGKDSDKGKFSTPSLRNIALTAPYMHDGRFATLEEVVEHYSTGVKRSATLDPNLAKHPDGGLHLSEADRRALAAFLRTLTDDKYSR
jgi:cytochrome c peroxidase